jgi:hypothetical protein
MKIGIFSIPEIPLGKQNVKDPRLDEVDKITKAKKKTYVQVELAGEGALLDCGAILTLKDSRADLILKDLEFVETRLARAEEETEKAMLSKLRALLEKEEFIFSSGLTDAEKQLISAYGLLTNKPVIAAEKQDLEDLNNLLADQKRGYCLGGSRVDPFRYTKRLYSRRDH